MKLRENGRSLLFGVLLALSLIPVWITPYPPLQDYPDWLLQAQILRRFYDPAFDFAKYYEILSVPLPNAGAVILIYLLSFIAPIEIAGKIALSLYLLAFPLSIVFFMRSVQRQPTAFEFCALLAGYNFFFYASYLGYLFGLCALLLALGYLWRLWPRISSKDLFLLSVSAMLILLMHPIPWAVLIFVIASWATLWSRMLGWRKILGLTIALLPSIATLAIYLGYGGGRINLRAYPSLAIKLESYVEPLQLAFEVQPWESALSATVVNLLIWIGLAFLGLLAIRETCRKAKLRKIPSFDFTFAITALSLLLITLVSPLWISDLLRPDERLVIPILILMAAAIHWPHPTLRCDGGLIAIYIFIFIVNSATFIRGGRELAVLTQDLSPFVTSNRHPFFLPVPCHRPKWADLDLPTVVDSASRAGFYWTIRRGGNNQQILHTRIVRLRDPSSAISNRRVLVFVPLADPKDDLELIASFLTAHVLTDYQSVALIGCPEFARKVAALLSDSFQTTKTQVYIRSPYLTILERLS